MLNLLDVVGDDDASADPDICRETSAAALLLSFTKPSPQAPRQGRQADSSRRKRAPRRRLRVNAKKRRGLISRFRLGRRSHSGPRLSPASGRCSPRRHRSSKSSACAPQKVLLFFDAFVGKVEPRQQWSLGFDKPGVVAEVEVARRRRQKRPDARSPAAQTGV